MAAIPEGVRRRMISDDLRAQFDAFIEQRVHRYIEISHQPITPNPHFAAVSAECIRLYTDGYFFSTVMVTQAVAEGIRRFVLERNEIKLEDRVKGPEAVDLLVKREIISEGCADAFNRMYESFRNDVHHMYPKVAQIDFPRLAKRNIQDLAAIEREIFAFKVVAGAIVPVNLLYWDIKEDGTADVFLRCSP